MQAGRLFSARIFAVVFVAVCSVCFTASANAALTFSAPTNYPTGTDPRSVIAADFDDDGARDLVTANRTAHTVSVLPGTGAGTFLSANAFSVGAGTNPWTVTSSDLNSDGFRDLITANANANSVSINQARHRNGYFRRDHATKHFSRHPADFGRFRRFQQRHTTGPGDR